MSLLAWPDGWRFPPHHVNQPRPRPPEPLPPEAGGPVWVTDDGRRACSDGHDLVAWTGDAPCFACYPGPGDKEN